MQREYTDVGRAGGPVSSGNILMWEGLGGSGRNLVLFLKYGLL